MDEWMDRWNGEGWVEIAEACRVRLGDHSSWLRSRLKNGAKAMPIC